MGELLHPVVHGRRVSWVVYMCSSWLQLDSGSRDLSQAEKRITVIHKIQKMTTLSIQDNFERNFLNLLSFT